MNAHAPTLSTCDLCDQHLDDASGALRVIALPFASYGARRAFSGTIATVQCLDDNSRVREALAEPGAGRVLVVDGGASLRRALVGGNVGASAAKNAWAGVVVVGAVRDVAELAPLPIGILALGSCPMATVKRGQGLRDVPVMVGGVWLHPGETLVADADGVVVLAAAA